MTGTVTLEYGDEDGLLQAVATIGPIACAMDGAPDTFRNYRDGIYSSDDCETDNQDHGVTVIGYGEENGQKYWLVKNQ